MEVSVANIIVAAIHGLYKNIRSGSDLTAAPFNVATLEKLKKTVVLNHKSWLSANRSTAKCLKLCRNHPKKVLKQH